MRLYTYEKALAKVKRNTTSKEVAGKIYVLQGTAGNSALGAISFLQKAVSRYFISIVPEVQFNRM